MVRARNHRAPAAAAGTDNLSSVTVDCAAPGTVLPKCRLVKCTVVAETRSIKLLTTILTAESAFLLWSAENLENTAQTVASGHLFWQGALLLAAAAAEATTVISWGIFHRLRNHTPRIGFPESSRSLRRQR